MGEAQKSADIGLGKATLICNMDSRKRLEFIGEGLPILFASAKSLIEASEALKEFPREAEILQRQCEEECAKILILIDIVRCPSKKIASRIGPMMRWFYDHLARLIYAEAQSWKPVNAGQLQEYIDNDRKSHYLEGDHGEFIMENWTLFERESSLYADVSADEDGEVSWNSPTRERFRFHSYRPNSYKVAEALEAFGVFTVDGLKILADVWGAHEVRDDTEWSLTRDLYLPLAQKLEAKELITERANNDHAGMLSHTWQLPMYGMDFGKITVPLERLREIREANLPYDI